MRAEAADSEQVLAALLELAPAGVEQVDGEGWVEYAIYGAAGELPALGEGEARVGGARVLVRGDEVPEDWAERWKRFHRPVLIPGRGRSGDLYVRPPWEEPALRPRVREIVIDPGQAFGTGTHPTTQLCLELLLGLPAEGSFADLGCGSGVLAIAAAKLGFDPVAAVDADRAAIAATDSNARVNGVRLARLERLDLREQAAPEADVMAANLMRPLLVRMAGSMTARPRALIVSGLLGHEADEVAAAFVPLAERHRLGMRGWSALLLA